MAWRVRPIVTRAVGAAWAWAWVTHSVRAASASPGRAEPTRRELSRARRRRDRERATVRHAREARPGTHGTASCMCALTHDRESRPLYVMLIYATREKNIPPPAARARFAPRCRTARSVQQRSGARAAPNSSSHSIYTRGIKHHGSCDAQLGAVSDCGGVLCGRVLDRRIHARCVRGRCVTACEGPAMCAYTNRSATAESTPSPRAKARRAPHAVRSRPRHRNRPRVQ